MKGVMIACVLVFLAMVFLAFRDELSLAERVVLVLILGLNPFLLEQSNNIGSHLPFLALFYLALWLRGRAEKIADQSPQGAARYVWFLAAGVVCYLAFATRTLGALVIPALLAAELIRKRRISGPVLAATAAFAVLAGLQAILLHSDVHYLDQFRSGLRLAGNLRDYSNRLAAFWHNGHWKPASIVLCLAVSSLSLVGYVGQLRRRVTFRELFTAGYVAVLLLWPSYQGEHYLLPVYPLYLFYAFLGLQMLARWSRLLYLYCAFKDLRGLAGLVRLLPRAIALVLALAIVVTYGMRLSGLQRSPLPEGIAKRESQELFKAVREQTEPGDLVVFVKPRAMALFTGRESMSYHQAARDEDLWKDLNLHQARWLVVVENDNALRPDEDPKKMSYLRGFVHRNRSRLERRYQNADFSLYAIRTYGPVL
jgi:hypothetical protein